MYDKILAFLYRVENSPVFSSVKKGFILIIPVVLTGSLALLLQNIPIAVLRQFFLNFAGGAINTLLGFIFDATVGFMSAALVLSVSYYYSAGFAVKDNVRQILAMLTALTSFVASFGGAGGSLTLESFGTTGVFTALLCAILATRLYFFFHHHLVKHVHYRHGTDIQYQNALYSIVPMLLTVTIFALINYVMVTFLKVNNFNELTANALLALFRNMSNELQTSLLFIVMLNLLWFLGIHGGNALDPVAQLMFEAASTDPGSIISKSFLDNFAVIGGCGASLCLLLALLISSRFKSSRQLAYSATPLILFNMNEILVYGLPIVLNPVLLIPFILVPLVSLLIAYFANLLGLMPLVTNNVTWTTPIFFSGYLATGSIAGSLVQLVIITVGTACYIPFIRFSEHVQEKRITFLIKELNEQFWAAEQTGDHTPFLSRNDSAGTMAKALVAQLQLDIKEDHIPIFYQPQLDAQNRVTGAEALLRWQYAEERIPPPLVIALAKEDGCYDALTWCILSQICRDMQALKENPDTAHLSISANISAEQLDDASFVRQLIALAQHHQICENLVIEITEETTLSNLKHVGDHIELLRQNQIMTAIDDFSMGQTSLDYLRDNSFDYVKLDGGLVRQTESNLRCREIVSSIVTLGKNLNFRVLAEHVETEELRQILLDLDCRLFQGYLYSPAVPFEQFVAYFLKKRQENAQQSA